MDFQMGIKDIIDIVSSDLLYQLYIQKNPEH